MAMTLIRSHWRCTFQSFRTAENVSNSTNCVLWAWGWNFYPFLHRVQVPWIIDNLWTWLLTPQKIESRPSLGQMVCELRKLFCNQRINVSIRLQLCLMCVVSIVQARCAMHQNHVRYKSLALPNAQTATEDILQRLDSILIGKIFYTRQLRLLHRVACMDPNKQLID